MKIGQVSSKGINVTQLGNRCVSLCTGEKPSANDIRMMSIILSKDTGHTISPRLINNLVYRNILVGKII